VCADMLLRLDYVYIRSECMCVHVETHTYAYEHTHTYAYEHTHTCAYAAYIQTYRHTCIHTSYMHTYLQINVA